MKENEKLFFLASCLLALLLGYVFPVNADIAPPLPRPDDNTPGSGSPSPDIPPPDEPTETDEDTSEEDAQDIPQEGSVDLGGDGEEDHDELTNDTDDEELTDGDSKEKDVSCSVMSGHAGTSLQFIIVLAMLVLGIRFWRKSA